MTPTVALATCAEHPAGFDEEPLLDALERAGVAWAWALWDDPAVDWSGFGAVVVRSTWDYIERAEVFLDWVARVEAVATVVNPGPVIRWNAHKGYLVELADAGVDVVPTELVRAADEVALASLVHARGWQQGCVLKPAVSSGAVGLAVCRAPGGPDAAGALGSLQAAGHDVLVQPLVEQITTTGETSVMFLAGEPTHAVTKVPVAGDIRSQPHLGASVHAADVTPAQLALGRRAIAAAAQSCGVAEDAIAIARVDCVDVDGRPLLMELELIEPYLFLPFAPAGAADRLAALLVRRS